MKLSQPLLRTQQHTIHTPFLAVAKLNYITLRMWNLLNPDVSGFFVYRICTVKVVPQVNLESETLCLLGNLFIFMQCKFPL